MARLDSRSRGMGEWILENLVTIIFVGFTIFGFMVSSGVSVGYFFSELSSRVFRNSFLVLSLIIPVLAGLGLNFGIVIGAMSGQVAIAIARYFEMGGLPGLLFCFAAAMVVALFCGYLTGRLYNKTRGQEMIASLIVGFFANGIYQFIFLFAVGVIIPVPAVHPMIKPDGVGIRMTVDL
ncbi:MAG: ABC transporter permease, partial [Synergistaceae bacterium]|nr:ABC transporter permease [Synergistaceae bacterium]